MTNVIILDPAVRAADLAELALLVADAARIVPPLWPLDGAIAVNPLAGLEHLPFDEAVREGAELFGARHAMALPQWRRLVEDGRLDRCRVRDAAIERLGGWAAAFAPLGPDVSALDCLLARLFDLPAREETGRAPDQAALLTAKWCAAFFDRGVAASPMPGRELGLYRAVSALLPYDPDFRRMAGRQARSLLDGWPQDPLQAIARGLDVPEEARLEALRRLVARLPGWAGHIRWRTEHADDADSAPAGMADLIALLMLADRAVGRPARPEPVVADPEATVRSLSAHFGHDLAKAGSMLREVAAMDEADLGLLFQLAAERHYRDALVGRLPRREPGRRRRPDAQLLFCIDVRSEPFRRALEAEGEYETVGYAGFFGLPVAMRAPHRERSRRLPVLVEPQHDVALVPEPGSERRLRAERSVAAGRDLLQFGKNGAATTFATAEAAGPLAGLAMLANGVAPRVAAKLRALASPKLAPCADACGDAPGLTLAERVAYARAMFALTGMERDTAPLVVLVGHRGAAVNNPYAAALDCGACGGHGGGDNARLMADILNDPEVRAALAADGRSIPAGTLFVAGEHCTTTDEVALPDLDTVPVTHRMALMDLAHALERAGEANRIRRAAALGREPEDLPVGAAHWGEVRPEWGLAGAAAFIAGPRWLTREVDLEGRAFLHSYDWRGDPDGEALETILTAPMVVAQWIGCQYLFSTLDPETYGAGDKTVHNPVGRLGVVRGNGGDLRVGLPRQSCFRDDGSPQHVPQRLLAVVYAPMNRVEAVIERQAILRRLFGNGWVQLVVIDPATGRTRRWRENRELAAPSAEPVPAPVLAAVEPEEQA